MTDQLLASLADLKVFLDRTDTSADAELTRILAAASAYFLSQTGASFDGVNAIPADVSQAVIEHAASIWARKGKQNTTSMSRADGSASYEIREIPIFTSKVIAAYASDGRAYLY